ncbi:MAG: hypothetical protein J6Q17_03580, partial [Clostridia bacterium]|nr:hypothetical protein [Clostridia bacterium]
MTFDSRDKKPKLYDILILTLLFALIAGATALLKLKIAPAAVCAAFDGYFLLVFLMLVFAFVRQIEYNPYSYNTIFYMGFALFDLFVLVFFVVLTVRVLRQPDVFGMN